MRKSWLLSVSFLALLTACDLSPDYTNPDVSTTPAFREDTAPAATVAPITDGKWKRFDEHAQIEETAWWRMFNNDALNALEEQAMKDNPSLEVAQQRVINARANVDAADASLLPTVSVGAGPTREQISPASINATLPPTFHFNSIKPYTLYTAQGTISYEFDLFGKNRNTARQAEYQAESEENNYRASRLTLQADVAQAYYQLAALRMESNILTRTIATRSEFLKLTYKKRDVGEVDDLQVTTAETDLANVQSDAAAVAQQIAVEEHALAVLVGKPPAELNVAEIKITTPPPVIPAGMPSTLLERRPDIKAAERNIAAANAEIGIARAGYFPDISLSAVGGYTSSELGHLFDWSNRTWLLGPLSGTVLSQPIFEGGRLSAALAQTKSDYASAVASYRGSVLQAFREVEDQLSGLHHLSDQAAASAMALKSANRAYAIASARYKVGYSSYLEHLDAERSQLAAQRADVQVMGNRYITTIQLIKALGCSWQAAQPAPASDPVATAPAAVPIATAPTEAKPAATNTPAKATSPASSTQPALAPLQPTDDSAQAWWKFWE